MCLKILMNICLNQEMCSSLNKTNRNAKDYDDDTVIVYGEIIDNVIYNPKIIN
jgi:hypothetical protein